MKTRAHCADQSHEGEREERRAGVERLAARLGRLSFGVAGSEVCLCLPLY